MFQHINIESVIKNEVKLVKLSLKVSLLLLFIKIVRFNLGSS